MFIKKFLPCFLVIFIVATCVFGQNKADCGQLNINYQKKVCSGIENNQASYIKDLMERRSGKYNLDGVLAWVRDNYDCVYCLDEPGFRGGTMLRKVVFEDALTVAFFFVYQARVDMNMIERDGRTLANWLLDDTEKAFDAAFGTENGIDRKYLIKQIRSNQKYYNIFRNNGAKLRSELRQGGF